MSPADNLRAAMRDSIDMTDKQENHEADIEGLKVRVAALEYSMHANTEITLAAKGDTAELLELFRSVRGGFKVMGWLGNFAKWVVALAAMFAAIYAFVQNVRGIK